MNGAVIPAIFYYVVSFTSIPAEPLSFWGPLDRAVCERVAHDNPGEARCLAVRTRGLLKKEHAR